MHRKSTSAFHIFPFQFITEFSSLSLILIMLLLSIHAFSQVPDSSFAGTGFIPYGASGNSEWNKGIGNNTVIQPDGKIIVAIDKLDPNNSDLFFYTYRFLEDGTPDPDFGDNGVSAVFAGDQSKNCDLLLQDDGKIVLVGESEYCTGGVCGAAQFVMMRINSNGLPDSSFNDDGILLTEDVFGSTGLYAKPIKVLPCLGNKYLIGGKGIGYQSFIGRILNDGSVDQSFAINGIFTDTSYYAKMMDLTCDSLGNIYGLLHYYHQTDTLNISDVSIFKLLPDGNYDTNFGLGGKLVISTSNVDAPASIALRNDGLILVGGMNQSVYLTGFETGYGEINRGFLLALNPDGSPSALLENGSHLLLVPGDSATFIHKVLFTPDNRLMVSGRSITKINGNYHEKAFIGLFDQNLQPDTSFNANGLMVFDYGQHSNIGSLCGFNDLDILPNGKVLATGYLNPLAGNVLRSLFLLKLKNVFEPPVPNTLINPFSLQFQFYPNPVSETGRLDFILLSDEKISLNLIDVHGHNIHSFFNGINFPAGHHSEDLSFPPILNAGNYFLEFKSRSGKKNIQLFYQ